MKQAKNGMNIAFIEMAIDGIQMLLDKKEARLVWTELGNIRLLLIEVLKNLKGNKK